MFEAGTEVRPRRARPAFWRWEHTFARVTRDIVAFDCKLWGGGVRAREGGGCGGAQVWGLNGASGSVLDGVLCSIDGEKYLVVVDG